MAIFILRIYLYPRYFLEYSGDVFFRMAMNTIVRIMLNSHRAIQLSCMVGMNLAAILIM